METGDENLLLPTALRLRMAIECLAYELLQSYQDEIDDSTMEVWQPGRLIKELKEIDSNIENDRSISIGIEDISGEPPKKMHSLGTDRRLTASWINKHWNTLGSYLHEPTIRQHKDGNVFNPCGARAKIAEISGEVDRILTASLFATNFKVNIAIDCQCGYTITRREELLRRDRQVVCASCNALWGAEESEIGWRFVQLYHEFRCPNCNGNNKFPAKELNDRREFTCKDCGTEIILKLDWCLKIKSDPGKFK